MVNRSSLSFLTLALMIRTHVHSVHFSTFHREWKRGALPRVLAVLNKANALSKRSQLTWRIGADTLTDGRRERGGRSRARGNLLERSLFGVRISNIVCMEEDLLRHNQFHFFVIFQICKCLYRNSITIHTHGRGSCVAMRYMHAMSGLHIRHIPL